MKLLTALLIGIFFGIVLIKAEVISWFRIQEMFRFQAFHMYGVIGSAVVVGALSLALIRKLGVRSLGGETIAPKAKPFNKVGNLAGGLLFGFGWALTGACPGPLYALVGAGNTVVLVIIASAILGAFAYGVLKPKLPH